ncbi:hypothetical protein BGZ70_002723 [Mortierella alpina]|uniref:AA1-like domain-containing protein n=1 Tax=Mortierella alpina TaxID=64518 RepID=A0A9P6ITR1_MORAP|nr:hypothetical protein BGZ70_002723 [Mortierella alpina]
MTKFALSHLAFVIGFAAAVDDAAAADLYVDGSQERIRVFNNDGGSCIYNYKFVGDNQAGKELNVYYSNHKGNFKCNTTFVSDGTPFSRLITCRDMGNVY